MNYTPSQQILDKYADILVNFALNSGHGINKGEVVLLQVPECAKPMLKSLFKTVLKSGGNPIIQYIPDEMDRDYYELASDDQLKYFPAKFLKGRIEEIDHSISIIAETNKKELEGIDPSRIMIKNKAWKPYMQWRDEKENNGRYTWTLALYGTQEMADEAKMTLEEYWDEIIKACYLDAKNPLEKWKDTQSEIERVRDKLNNLNITSLRVESEGTDLLIGLGEKRKWIGGSGRNIPSFELFTSPDWRLTEGHITFDQPLYRYGNLIENVYLEFKKGKVVKATAEKGQKILEEMIKVPNADKIGEFSLTDGRLSRITRFMAETLFDENRGGKYGNTHLALGKSYHDCFDGDPAEPNIDDWKKMGFNDSAVHTDIVSTLNRKVTAKLSSGIEKVIYENGKFTI